MWIYQGASQAALILWKDQELGTGGRAEVEGGIFQLGAFEANGAVGIRDVKDEGRGGETVGKEGIDAVGNRGLERLVLGGDEVDVFASGRSRTRQAGGADENGGEVGGEFFQLVEEGAG